MRPGDQRALPLPAGELVLRPVLPAGQADPIEGVLGGLALGAAEAAAEQTCNLGHG